MAFKDIRVLFIIPEICEDETQTSVAMQEAYASCKQNVMKTNWIREQDGEAIDFHKTDFIVFQEFAGELYEKTLDTKSVILGPWCLLSCLTESKPIPNVSWPLMNMAMYGCVVACSNLRKDRRQEFKFRIQAMGGHFTNTLVEANTHLVSDTVRSEKYHAAAPIGVKIMLPSWVDAVWEASQNELIRIDNPRFASHVCPPFHKLTISTTGFTSLEDKQKLERVINENGGRFAKQLVLKETDLLVCNGCNSDKYRAANKHKIDCVNAEWVYDSAKAGFAISVQNYRVKKATSTPTKSQDHIDPNFSTFSLIGNNSFAAKSVLQETAIGDAIMRDSTSLRRKSPTKVCDLIESLDVKKAKKAGPFLDGCSIYLCGFSSNQLEKLHKMLNFSGATRYDILSERITHVIVGDKSSEELKLIRSKNLQCALVSVAWIVDSMAKQQPVSEENYLISVANSPKSTDHGSPSVKKGLRLLKADVTLMEAEPTITTPAEPTKEVEGENDDEIMRQYLHAPVVENEEDTLAALIAGNQFDTEQMMSSKKEQSEFSEPSISISVDEGVSIFAKLKFAVTNFQAEPLNHIKTIIQGMGGTVVSRGYTGIPDYVIVPINNNVPIQTPSEIVTDLWITDCYENQKKEIEYYHRPISVGNGGVFEGMVIALSGYPVLEKSFLRELCLAMGALVQNSMARTANAGRNVLATTHLISSEESGRKYEAAVKWGLPVLRKEWILDSARTGLHQNITEYLIGGSKENFNSSRNAQALSNKKISKLSLVSNCVDVTPNTVGCSLEIPSSARKTPINLFKENSCIQNENYNNSATPSKIQQDCSTPQNQNVSTVFSQITPVQQIMSEAGLSDGTPKQPWKVGLSEEATLLTPKPWNYVKTPDTPYGECFVDPPPPELRKNFVRWMNKFPDIKPRQECLSTPLSELKRRLWKQICDKSFSEVSKKLDMDTSESDPIPSNLGIEALPSTPKRTIETENKDETPENKLVSEKLKHLESMLIASGGSRRSSRKLEPLPPQGKHHDKESQAFSVGWDENMDTDNFEGEAPRATRRPVFMISGVEADLRDRLVERLESLGATVSDLANYDPNCTHLLCPKLNRNEKLLASMAAGKWVLDVSYVEDSVAAGKLLEEEEYEFGNPKSSMKIKTDKGTEHRADCAHYWRKEVTRRGYGVFHDVRAIVVAAKREPIVRVIEAGGGMVINASPPFEKDIYATHCLLEVKTVQNFKDYIPLAQQGVICVNTLYINEFLHRQVDDFKDFLLPSFSKYYN